MIYVTGERVQAYQVRSAVFDTRWRGLDPAQVHDYLCRVADEMDRLHRELATARTEHVAVTAAGKPCRLPAALREIFA